MNVSHVPLQTALLGTDLRAKLTLERVDVTETVYCRQVRLQVALLCKDLSADVTLECAYITESMHCGQVSRQIAFLFKSFRADVALKILYVTNTVNSSHVQTHVAGVRELPAANITRVLGVRMLWSWRRRRSAVALSVRRVVVSADR